MKTLSTILIVVALFISHNILAQDVQHEKYNNDKREKIEALKVSYLTEKMNLTPEEAQKFWPVYNQYKADMKTLKKDKRALAADSKESFETMSDSEITALVDQKLVIDQKALDLKKKYHVEFKKVLPIKKVALLYKAEDQFKRELLKQMQKGESPQQKK
jgi:hypothetical protein